MRTCTCAVLHFGLKGEYVWKRVSYFSVITLLKCGQNCGGNWWCKKGLLSTVKQCMKHSSHISRFQTKQLSTKLDTLQKCVWANNSPPVTCIPIKLTESCIHQTTLNVTAPLKLKFASNSTECICKSKFSYRFPEFSFCVWLYWQMYF